MADDLEAPIEEVVEALAIDLESDRPVQIGDWSGPSNEFRKNWIPQSELQTMREKDKSEIDRQVAQRLDQEKARYAAERQQEQISNLQRAQHSAQQQQQHAQGGTFEDRIAQVYANAEANTGGYVSTEHLRQIMGEVVSAVNNEFGSRDRYLKQLAGGIDKFYGDYQGSQKTLQTLSGSYKDQTWTKFIDQLEATHGDFPRATLEMMAAGYEAADGETPDQLRAGISESIAAQASAMKAHRQASKDAAAEKARQVASVGMPGVGGKASPSQPQKVLRSPDEIADHFMGLEDPAS